MTPLFPFLFLPFLHLLTPTAGLIVPTHSPQYAGGPLDPLFSGHLFISTSADTYTPHPCLAANGHATTSFSACGVFELGYWHSQLVMRVHTPSGLRYCALRADEVLDCGSKAPRVAGLDVSFERLARGGDVLKFEIGGAAELRLAGWGGGREVYFDPFHATGFRHQ